MSRPAPAITPRVFHAQVVRRQPISPHVVGITVAGADLDSYPYVGPDQFLYVFLPRGDGTQPPVPHDFTFAGWRDLPEDERPIGRYYTVRHRNEETGELDMQFIVHGDGPATTWASQAQPGQHVALWGPRTAYNPPADTTWQLLFGDETGLPAIGAIIESRPAGTRVIARIEIPGPEDEQAFAVPEGVELDLVWLHRGELEAGRNDLLFDTATAIPLPADRYYIWGATEMGTTRRIKAFFEQERGVQSAQIDTVGYWRHRLYNEEGE